MFNKSERSKLSQFSVILYGSETGWQKRYDAGVFDVVVLTTEIEEPFDQVQLPNSKGGTRGTILSRVKALAAGLIKEGQVPDTYKRTVSECRKPTFDELSAALYTHVDALKVGQLNPDQLIQVEAFRYAVNGTTFKYSLATAIGQEGAVQDVLNLVPEARREAVSALIVKSGEQPPNLPLDAFQFISDLVFAFNHPAGAQAMAEQALDSADLTRPKNKIPYEMLRSMTVGSKVAKPTKKSAADKANRRSKNKAASRARRKAS